MLFRSCIVPDLRFYGLKTLGDLGGVLLGDDALLGQHLGMGNRPSDILLVQAPVVIDGNGVSAEIDHSLQTINPHGAALKEQQTPACAKITRFKIIEGLGWISVTGIAFLAGADNGPNLSHLKFHIC